MREITDEDIRRTVAKGKPYTLVLLRVGPRRDQDEATAAGIQQEHLRHLLRLRAEGKLLVNGPCLGEGDIRGVGIYAAPEADVRNWVEADPGVKSGRLVYEITPWFGIPGDALK